MEKTIEQKIAEKAKELHPHNAFVRTTGEEMANELHKAEREKFTAACSWLLEQGADWEKFKEDIERDTGLGPKVAEVIADYFRYSPTNYILIQK